jgi:hypothetical protein
MRRLRALGVRDKVVKRICAAILATLVALTVLRLAAEGPAQGPPKAVLPARVPEPIYSSDSKDPWNRIFYFLFSRRIEARLSDLFPEGAPFVDGISTRTFERDEIGDRAIDPLYPSNFVNTGSRLVLTEPAYADFRKALQDALDENVQRSVIARALMESDLWGAHDILFCPLLPADERELGERRLAALELISRLIRKVALTPEEIKSLPNNYSAAVQEHYFPDVFAKGSGWIEVLWFHPRAHDSSAGFRRTSRVFLKVQQPQPNLQRFLDGMRDRAESDPIYGLDGVALVTQLLLVDSQGKIEPTSMTSEVQVRLFETVSASTIKPNDGTLKKIDGTFERARLQVCEISRRVLLRDLNSGGLVPEDDSSRAYSGHYAFAEGEAVGLGPNLAELVEAPIEVTLRARCAHCHNEGLTQVNTFAIARGPRPSNSPPVRQLNPAGYETANFAIAEKMKRGDFESLRAYFNRAAPAATRH